MEPKTGLKRGPPGQGDEPENSSLAKRQSTSGRMRPHPPDTDHEDFDIWAAKKFEELVQVTDLPYDLLISDAYFELLMYCGRPLWGSSFQAYPRLIEFLIYVDQRLYIWQDFVLNDLSTLQPVPIEDATLYIHTELSCK